MASPSWPPRIPAVRSAPLRQRLRPDGQADGFLMATSRCPCHGRARGREVVAPTPPRAVLPQPVVCSRSGRSTRPGRVGDHSGGGRHGRIVNPVPDRRMSFDADAVPASPPGPGRMRARYAPRLAADDWPTVGGRSPQYAVALGPVGTLRRSVRMARRPPSPHDVMSSSAGRPIAPSDPGACSTNTGGPTPPPFAATSPARLLGDGGLNSVAEHRRGWLLPRPPRRPAGSPARDGVPGPRGQGFPAPGRGYTPDARAFTHPGSTAGWQI
jgi:hypothetical protein